MTDKDNLPSEEIQQYLKSCVDFFDKEDRSVRDRQIRLWRRLKLYWDGFQRVWWSEVAHDWRINDDVNSETNSNSGHYDKPVNVFRAYLESIIAALSITIPPVKCIPDNVDNALDLSTAKAGTRIAELVYKHNNAPFLWLHALYIFVTEGLVFCYNYSKADKSFGTYTQDEYGNVDSEDYLCPECGSEINDVVEDTDSPTVMCSDCQKEIPTPTDKTIRLVSKVIGSLEKAKSRQILEVYGGLYVKIPNYAINQEQIPYLSFSYETNYVNIIERWRHLSEKNDWFTKVGYSSGGLYDPYERWGRLNPQYRNEYPINTVTLRQIWLRPCAFNCLNPEQTDVLRKEYPDGVKVTLANDEFAEAYEEKLDDHWTLTRNPLSDYLHHDPLGLLLTSIQDITNEIISLTLQTIEHGIPQTFADPSVLNFKQYSETEVAPGTIYPARPASGKSVGEAFYEIKTATLSAEVLPFGNKIQELGQLVSGALPSLFGGTSAGGSNTASEYSMSRAQALQRLQVTWKMFTLWWKEIFSKVIPAFIEDMEEDESFTKEDPSSPGNYLSVYIRKTELEGKIGSVELEANETLPQSSAQIKDTLLKLMEMQNPIIMEALTAPENIPFISEALGLSQFKVPGEADRLKQYEEISLLLKSEPLTLPQADPITGMETEVEVPSIEPDPDVDNHAIQAEICKNWLISEAGQLAKLENQAGYHNVLLHMKMHTTILQMAMTPEMGAPGSMPMNNQQPPSNGTNNDPITPVQ